MAHLLELQIGSNPHPPEKTNSLTFGNKQNCLHLETSSVKCSATTNFLFSLSSLHALNKGIFHDITIYNYIKRQQQKNPSGVDKSNDPSTQLTCWIKELRNLFVPDRWQTFWEESQMPHQAGLIWVKFPIVRSLTRVKCPGIAGGGGFWNWLVHNGFRFRKINSLLHSRKN